MLNLQVDITPPRPSSRLATLSPKAFIMDAELSSPLKRKLHMRTMSDERRTRFRFDPRPVAEDHTILNYAERTQATFGQDREKLSLIVPFEDLLTGLEERFKGEKATRGSHIVSHVLTMAAYTKSKLRRSSYCWSVTCRKQGWISSSPTS